MLWYQPCVKREKRKKKGLWKIGKVPKTRVTLEAFLIPVM